METEIITSNEELKQLVKDGYFFNFCVAFALNKGFKDAMKAKNEVKFDVGDYEVKFDAGSMCFILTHKIYFARIITAYYQEVVFIGDNEEEVIADLLAELKKNYKADVNGCVCTPEESSGWTTVKCCNQCGLPVEKFWCKH